MSQHPRATMAWTMLAIAIVYLALAVHAPVAVRGDWVHDDALFMRYAVDLINGDWLGAYDNRTLAKGPGYALFLALGFILGLSVSISHALLHIAACASFSLVLLRLTHSRVLAWTVYLVLLWHPALLYGRVVRDTIYSSQVLLVCAGIIGLLTASRRGLRRPWLALATGLALGWFWLTREEGVWLLPALAVLAVLAAWWQPRANRHWRALLQSLLLVGLAFGAVNLGNRAINQSVYGVFVNTEFTGGEFKRALAALQSVRAEPTQPYVPVPEQTRAAVYAVSPAFSQLRWYLEDKASPGYFWRGFGCNFYPNSCGDMAGGWFMWALRDAAAYAGHYETAQSANTYYSRLADEIEAACMNGTLRCARGGLQLIPQITAEQWRKAPKSALQAIELLIFLRDKPDAAMTLLTAPPERAAEVKRMLGRPLTTALAPAPADANLDWYHASDLPPSEAAKAARRVHRAFIKAYAVLLPLLLVSGLACFLIWAIKLWRRRSADRAWVFAVTLTMWGLLGTRIALLVLVDISAFPGITQYYLMPAYALLCTAAVLSIYGCFAKSPRAICASNPPESVAYPCLN